MRHSKGDTKLTLTRYIKMRHQKETLKRDIKRRHQKDTLKGDIERTLKGRH